MHQVEQILRAQIKRTKTPSVLYLIFDKENILHKFKEGFADIKNRHKVDDDTTYTLFSITKTFTALVALQLAEMGKVSLDDSLKHICPISHMWRQ